MGGHKSVTGTSHEALPPGPVVYTVTGNPDPDSKGSYIYGGQYNDHPYYRRLDGAYFIFYDDSTPGRWWYIAAELGEKDHCWYEEDATILGDYEGSGACTGTATVTGG